MPENSRASTQQRDAEMPPENARKITMIIHSIGELAIPPAGKNGAIHGKEMANVDRHKNAAVAIAGERIVAIGPSDEVLKKHSEVKDIELVDAGGKLVTPGLVDPHTHLIFGGNRANEFIMRCQGKTYTEIAEAGGGIVASMRATRSATATELAQSGLKRLQRMLQAGTTTCEVKTGYGLDAQSELAMLEAIYQLQKQQPVELIATFMPAHAVPPGTDRDAYVQEIVDDMLSRAASLSKQHGVDAPIIDVFCDRGYFTLDDTRKIFEAARALKMPTKVHADEFVNLGATKLAVEHKSLSADHLLNVSDEEIAKLSASETVAVLLPGTSFYLNLAEHAPARKMIESGVAVALGSDFNPGSCHIFSLPLIWGLACLHLRMTPAEALTALTVNAAYAIGAGDKVGQIAPGYQADITIYDVQTMEEVPYNLGWNPVAMTIKKGSIVHRI
ncbi:MAG: imidazolonepropionase [Cyanobacteria bacterium SZAS LIN-5]|nr:imidazolonepropionase [Cyanobacteria bacterium SZAS LIN-5]